MPELPVRSTPVVTMRKQLRKRGYRQDSVNELLGAQVSTKEPSEPLQFCSSLIRIVTPACAFAWGNSNVIHYPSRGKEKPQPHTHTQRAAAEYERHHSLLILFVGVTFLSSDIRITLLFPPRVIICAVVPKPLHSVD